MPYFPEKKPEPSGEETKQKKLTEKQSQLLRFCVAILSLLLILYGAVSLIRYIGDLSASRMTSRELREIYNQPTEPPAPAATEETTESSSPETAEDNAAAPSTVQLTASPVPTETPSPLSSADTLQPVAYPDNPNLNVTDRFLKLRKKSKYIVGWLTLDGVDEAVARKDNTFFLNHDALGTRNSNGAIFLDEDISLLTRPYTLIMYGHNMKSGHMFGRLKKYKETAYYHENRIITFDSMYEEGQYAVFAVLEINTVPGTATWYDLWSLDTDSRSDREKAIRKLESRSLHSALLDVQADDQILLLVTCLDGEDERLVVAARRLRKGETPGSLTIR